MTEMRDVIIFVGFWRPPSSPDATILNYLNDREGAGIIFCRILAPPPPPNAPPSHDATILNYLNDREGGAIFLCRILAPPPPSPDATIHINDLNGRKRGWGANIL